MSRLAGTWARTLCAAAVLGGVLAGPATPAAARPALTVAPPNVDPALLGEAQALSGNPGPLEPTEQQSVCAEPAYQGGQLREAPFAQRVLDLPAAWQFSRGAGQKVAVIDTGVNPHPRLRALQPGGDFVSDTDGTVDCDSHGTLVAGIVAAQPSPDDAFAGVAPDAEILTIRQLSLAYRTKENRNDTPPGTIDPSGYGNVLTLAAAVVRAVDMGATVINISEVACTSASATMVDGALGAAVRYAYESNVVVVAAAGNFSEGSACGTQNTGTGWDKVQTVASPAWFSPYVLSVASVEPDGSPSPISLYGPWVGVAAVGRKIVSLDSKPGGVGLVNAVQTQQGMQTIDGTSFAAPYVSGLAALVRARFPELTAQQVMDRITRTAHGPGIGRDDRIGHGLIDPVAALTDHLPDEPVSAGADVPRAFPEPPRPPEPARLPRLVATIGSITCLTILALGFAISIPYRRRRDSDALPELD
ncbi:type VII secretion-associated serine protease mycosin [Nocardia sp. CC227C]|uniref:type VII secretion-associated serine protease mycosin n=1 Tax=Nocardia sp. CC227C TaxID=3044562 RepID=UPI00278BE145|nr:type VII secretion-associated serine protease mycosin [Nocardia sp. CC227C]